MSKIQKIKELHELLKNGVINDKEFAQLKTEVINATLSISDKVKVDDTTISSVQKEINLNLHLENEDAKPKGTRDKSFREAAEIVVKSQNASASVLQQKLGVGYNRLGRLLNQLEAEGIIGPFEDNKNRKVLINDVIDLEHFFDN